MPRPSLTDPQPERELGCPAEQRLRQEQPPKVSYCGYPGRQSPDIYARNASIARFIILITQSRSSSTYLTESLLSNQMRLPNIRLATVNEAEPFFADPLDLVPYWSWLARCNTALAFLSDVHQLACGEHARRWRHCSRVRWCAQQPNTATAPPTTPCFLVAKIFPGNCDPSKVHSSTKTTSISLDVLLHHAGSKVVVMQRSAREQSCSKRWARLTGDFGTAREAGHSTFGFSDRATALGRVGHSAANTVGYARFKAMHCNGTSEGEDDAADQAHAAAWFQRIRQGLARVGKRYLNVSFEDNTQRHEELMARISRFLAEDL